MKRAIAFVLFFSLVAIVILNSCSKSSDTTPVLTRESLVGKWMVTESKKKTNYEVTITIDTTSKNGILLYGFAGAYPTVYAIAYLGGNTLTLKSYQTMSNGWVVNGSGTVTGTTRISWPFSLHDGADLTNHVGDFVKE